MTIDIDERQRAALSCLGFWWRCVVAGNEVDGEGPIPSSTPILNYVANGATAIVTAQQLDAIAAIRGLNA